MCVRKVKLYISDFCLSCEEAIQYFINKGFTIEKINVTYDQDRLEEMLQLGGIAPPLIVIERKVFHVFNRSKIDQWLEEINE